MNTRVALAVLIAAGCLMSGCVSKLVRIDSSPAFANIEINDEYIGKTPLYYRFRERWYPWPIKKTDDYSVVAQLEGYEPAVRVFKDTPPPLNIGYVPDEIVLEMQPAEAERNP
ncbi:MAG: PEGA domain-containing protein [Desulfobacterales bacterium]|nr:PEGA domain-containing protein [Desulfobacterales bacterium]